MIRIELTKYSDFEYHVTSKSLKHFKYIKGSRTFLIAVDGPLYFYHPLSDINKDRYDETLLSNSNEKFGDEIAIKPFAAKGKNHFRGKGVKKNCGKGSTTFIDFVIPPGSGGIATFRYNAIEILNGQYGDSVDLKIIDNESGSYSGYPSSPPVVTLDQFGDNWNTKPEMSKELPYEATLYTGMIIRVEYTNNDSDKDRDVYVNHDLHLVI
jgi:hypothetical protein